MKNICFENLIPSEISTIEMVEYDFEKYVLEHGIPETLDPLPYRKAGSVFAIGDDAEPVLTSAKNDPRLRTVVCRHWLRDLCMKGAACEFLHQYDLSKMPLCRHGDRCKIHDCPFRHISEADRLECVFFSQGFCIHGPFCRYKHVRRERTDIPVVADFTLGLSQMQAGKDGVTTRRPAPKPNEFYKVSLCKHFLQGDCPFADQCHFAHGDQELKKFPRNHGDENGAPSFMCENGELLDKMFNTQENTTIDYFKGGSSGGGKPIPILDPENASFFIVKAALQRDLIISNVKGQWYVQRKDAEILNRAKESGKLVMIFFTVSESNHIQGAAMMLSTASYIEDCDYDSNIEGFCYRFKCEWYRTTEMFIEIALEAAPDLLLPTNSTEFCLGMTDKTGEALMKALWNSPLVTLYEPFCENGVSRKLNKPFRLDESEVTWPTMPGPGFIFGCNSQTMDECLGRGILGLPLHMKLLASVIQPGSTIFLYNVTDHLLFGIFEAVTPAIMNIEPRAFSKNPKATSSPFPVQIRIRVSLECPPVQDTHLILNEILRSRVGGRIGPITHAQAEAIASLLATQCGALQFMIEYSISLATGNENVIAPPIAVPPLQIFDRKSFNLSLH